MIDVRVYAEFVPDPLVVHFNEPYQGPGTVKLRGYVCGYKDEERAGGPAAGGWLERIPREAFEEALRAESDVHLRWNFDGLPLATRKASTMTLTLDDTGLYVEASVDAEAWNAKTKRVRDDAGDIDLGDLDIQWGFSFLDKDREWSIAPGTDDDYTHREIKKLELRDIGIVVVSEDITAQAAVG